MLSSKAREATGLSNPGHHGYGRSLSTKGKSIPGANVLVIEYEDAIRVSCCVYTETVTLEAYGVTNEDQVIGVIDNIEEA